MYAGRFFKHMWLDAQSGLFLCGTVFLFIKPAREHRVERDAREEDDHRVACEGGVGAGDHPEAVGAHHGDDRNHEI